MVSVCVIGVSLVSTVSSHRQIDRHRFVDAKKVYENSASSEGIMGASVPMLERMFLIQWPNMY